MKISVCILFLSMSAALTAQTILNTEKVDAFSSKALSFYGETSFQVESGNSDITQWEFS